MDLHLSFVLMFCLHSHSFYACFFGSNMDLHLSFVPIFLYIINNFYGFLLGHILNLHLNFALFFNLLDCCFVCFGLINELRTK
jgi:hypothetical protein